MANRPAIPAELRRRILVEAGHRCAIHTCRSTDVDVHHIVPWEKVQEHAYDNLIALCPNCHRRADSDEIDRKSLRLYKTQLSAALGIAGLQTAAQLPGLSIPSRRDRWVTSLVEDSNTEPVPYEITIEFPQFLPNEGDLAELNTILLASAMSLIQEYRRHRLITPTEFDQQWTGARDGYWESFEVSLFTEDLISSKHSVSVYGAGAAHPNHFTRTANYQRGPLIPLHFSDIFSDDAAAVACISQYCQADLARQKQLDKPDEWIAKGAGDHSNFQAFNILPYGLLFTFDPYQVGSYAEGPYQVHVPFHALSSLVRSDTKVAALWKPGSAA